MDAFSCSESNMPASSASGAPKRQRDANVPSLNDQQTFDLIKLWTTVFTEWENNKHQRGQLSPQAGLRDRELHKVFCQRVTIEESLPQPYREYHTDHRLSQLAEASKQRADTFKNEKRKMLFKKAEETKKNMIAFAERLRSGALPLQVLPVVVERCIAGSCCRRARS